MKGVLDGPDGKPVLFVGSDNDDAEAQKKGYAILCVCKEGPHGHRHILDYHTLGAPHDSNYYHVTRGKRMALNVVDMDDPNFIQEAAIFPGLSFINKHLNAGDKVLIHCNAGKSRGPSTALAYLRTIEEMPYSFRTAEKIFKAIYPAYSPGNGMRTFVRTHWQQLKDNFYGTK